MLKYLKRISKEADEDANTRPDSCPQNRNHVKRSKLSTGMTKRNKSSTLWHICTEKKLSMPMTKKILSKIEMLKN